MNRMNLTELKQLANRIRIHCVQMTGKANASHIGSALSSSDVLAALYGSALRYDPNRPDWPDRDRFIMSKGHACTALYATLAESGFFPAAALETFYQNGSPLAGHVMHKNNPGVELSTGSLGHGLPVAVGMALAAKRDGRPSRVFCLVSDGECDEGSIWEAALFAPQHQLDNLVVIVDYNGIQSLGAVKDVIDLHPLAEKWRAFRWAVREIDGHDMRAVEEVLTHAPFELGRPSCVIAHTVKGKGVSYMENKLLWHYRAPMGEDLTKALAELEQNK
ncbi:MAG TPA: transketolase [Candidatus Acidoferrum sp.]|nr:transketolase [Candidatus Acidoferrum sp.]